MARGEVCISIGKFLFEVRAHVENGLLLNLFITYASMCHREKTSSIHLFQVSSLEWLWLMIFISTTAMKMLAKETGIFVSTAMPMCLKIIFAVKLERVFF